MIRNVFDLYPMRVIQLRAQGKPKWLAEILATGHVPCDRYGALDVPLPDDAPCFPDDAHPLRRQFARWQRKEVVL